ncbi:MAG: metalloregulator ArsR/SmtB family transcription factor [Rubritalea sp.]|uniref:ArsR/SmtB family transcription factor n=1 Tax=Rubritalea sp. TaxID=2109375 RepID=UPI003241D380
MNIKNAVIRLSALSQESRLSIFRLLVRCGDQGLSAGEIAEHTGIQANTLSFHLRELASAELIQSERKGRSIIYSLAIDGMRDLIHFLTEDCCQGRPELCKTSSDYC